MTLCEAMSRAIKLATVKGFGCYVMRKVGGDGYEACLFCDHCPSAVVGVVMPDGSYYGL